MSSISYRPLATIDDFAGVVDLERVIWGPGYNDVVPVPILAVTVKRGGILIGAFDEGRMAGFVYSLPGIKQGAPTQWSHMLGVLAEYRSSGIGHRLKVLQRERALEMSLDLIEWTYDPLQAMNAHLNFSKLGTIVEEYEENIYGVSNSPLHRGNPTDRFVAEWRIRDDRVRHRLAGAAPMAPVVIVEPLNRSRRRGEWLEPAEVRDDVDARHVSVEIPIGFTELLAQAPELALEWRMTTRRLFTAYFERSYRAVEFFLNREAGAGSYLLVRK